MFWVFCATTIVVGFFQSSCGAERGLGSDIDPGCVVLRKNLPNENDVSLEKKEKALSAQKLRRFLERTDLPIKQFFWGECSGFGLRGVEPWVLRSQVVELEIEPGDSRIVGATVVEVVAEDSVVEGVRFGLDADTASVGPAGVVGDWVLEDGVLEVNLDQALAVGESVELVIEWRAENVEQVVEYFPEGGGEVLANLVSGESTFFTTGYRFWPVPLGERDLGQLEFLVTVPGELDLVMAGERVDVVDNGDGTRTERWVPPGAFRGTVGLALGDYRKAVADCGAATLEIYGLPGPSIDGFAIEPGTYAPILEDFCEAYRGWFDEVGFATVRLVGVDERFTNGFSTPGLILVPNYVWDDDGSGSFAERDFYLAHELSHQWWGNDVTISDMRDVWLIEGMADYLAAEAIEETQSATTALRLWLWEVQPYLEYLAGGGQDHPLVPDSGTDMEPRVYYIKGAWVLRMLEQVIGQDDMRELLGAARAQHPFAPIDTATFTALAEDISGQELDWFFEQWLSGTGVMELEAKVGSSDEGIELEISQQGAWSEGRYYRMPLEVRLHQGKQERIETIEIEGQTTTFNLDPL
jgi:hypothetical protein